MVDCFFGVVDVVEYCFCLTHVWVFVAVPTVCCCRCAFLLFVACLGSLFVVVIIVVCSCVLLCV